jgi:hypothetical protein
MQFINLTPHTITIRRTGTLADVLLEDIIVPPSGTVARVTTTETCTATVDGVRFVRRKLGHVTNLPRHADGMDDTTVAVLVSSMVLAAVPGRANTYAPDSGPSAIRDTAGNVIAVTQLVAA